MDKNTYEKWWELHLRASRGENLAKEEQDFYVTELGKLQYEEKLKTDTKILREARRNVAALSAEHDQMQTRREKLESEIRALEAVLGEKSQQLQ
jgi:hypothetical protein